MKFRSLPSVVLGAMLVGAIGSTTPGLGQPVPREPMQTEFLFVNQERLLTGSRTGRALLEEEETATEELRQEARAIDADFEAREREIASLRAEITPEEFRALADEFDAEVVEARRLQDARSAALAQRLDLSRRQFFGQIAPLLVAAMERHGAAAIFDETSVLLSDQSINITDEIILAIDATLAPENTSEPSSTTQPQPTIDGGQE